MIIGNSIYRLINGELHEKFRRPLSYLVDEHTDYLAFMVAYDGLYQYLRRRWL